MTESSTTILRRMLDERGVEWTYEDGTVSFNDGKRWFHAWAYNDGAMCVSMGYLTPEQAIAATLGSCNCTNDCTNGERTETCHDKNGFDPELGFECTVCGAMTDGYMLSPADMGHYTQFNFCPMCGRRIEQ